jgi:DNA topoisomerase IB
VWICPDPNGHLQAVGTDAAGRRQYLYHPRWRERRDQEKFERMLEFAERLPALRRRVARDLGRGDLGRRHVLAAAVRLLDRGCFRIGTEPYAQRNGTFGLATIRRDHVRVRDDVIEFDYDGKGGARVTCEVRDAEAAEVVRRLRRRRGGGEELLAYREGRRWRDVRSEDVNDYIKEHAGDGYTAKDFRTWRATVLAAAGLAARGPVPPSQTGQRRAISSVVRDVAEHLGNTPAVARGSYVDPRIFDRFRSGWTIAPVVREGEVVADGVRADGSARWSTCSRNARPRPWTGRSRRDHRVVPTGSADPFPLVHGPRSGGRLATRPRAVRPRQVARARARSSSTRAWTAAFPASGSAFVRISSDVVSIRIVQRSQYRCIVRIPPPPTATIADPTTIASIA